MNSNHSKHIGKLYNVNVYFWEFLLATLLKYNTSFLINEEDTVLWNRTIPWGKGLSRESATFIFNRKARKASSSRNKYWSPLKWPKNYIKSSIKVSFNTVKNYTESKINSTKNVYNSSKKNPANIKLTCKN